MTEFGMYIKNKTNSHKLQKSAKFLRIIRNVLLESKQVVVSETAKRDYQSVMNYEQRLLTHPHESHLPTVAVLPCVAPAGAISVFAQCQNSLSAAPSMEYAIIITESEQDILVNFSNLEWHRLLPLTESIIELEFEVPTRGNERIYLLTRLAPGFSENSAWATWSDIIFQVHMNAVEENTDNTPYEIIHFASELETSTHASNCSQRSKTTRYFDPDYYTSMYEDVRKSGIDPFEHYSQFGWKEHRSPSPEFDSWFACIANKNVCTIHSDPLQTFASLGFPENFKKRPKNAITLHTSKITHPAGKDINVAIHAHLFYSDCIEQLHIYLQNINIDLMLFVTVISPADAEFVCRYLNNRDFKHKFDVRVVSNCGRDLGPMVTALNDVWENFDVIGHIHSKRSPHTDFGEKWCTYLFDSMLGSNELVENVIGHFAASEKIGFMFPDNFFEIKKFMTSDSNTEKVHGLLQRIAVNKLNALNKANEHMQAPHFAAGSMAWMRTSVYRSFVASFKDETEFEHENAQVDNTVAHAIERALPLISSTQGYDTVVYYTNKRPPTPEYNKFYNNSVFIEPGSAAWKRDDPAISVNKPRKLKPLSKIYNKNSLNIHWIIPAFGRGAGGHMTIFRIINELERFGHIQTLWIQNASPSTPPKDLKFMICQWYKNIGSNVHVRHLPDDTRQLSGDIIIATDVWTVYPAIHAENFKERCYFIQDYEPYFHAMGENYLIAEETYKFNLFGLCAGKWLNNIAARYGMSTAQWDLAVDHEIFYPIRRALPSEKQDYQFKIAFYSRGYTPRRAKKLGLAAFEQLKSAGLNFKVILFGEEPTGEIFRFNCDERGILTSEGLAALYREVDIGVVFSTTNYSLVPLEMMSCRLPVVEIDADSTRLVFDGGEVTFAKPDPSSVASEIMKLLKTPKETERQVELAYRFVRDLDWRTSAKKIELALFRRLEELKYESISVSDICSPPINRNAQPKVSVFIPTFNAGSGIVRLIDGIISQRFDEKFDVLVIDSGSSDGTVENVLKYKHQGVRLIEIPNSEFQHGRTRNLGFSETRGEFVAITTQDALPQDEFWLKNLIGGFSKSNDVAGVIGRHISYPEHGLFEARDLDEMFARFDDFSDLYSWKKGLPSFLYPGSPEWQMTLQFYSDNNSAMRRSAWQKLPYPEVDWGEDQIWSWEALKLGFAKAYVHDAVMIHSHPAIARQKHEVAQIEGEFFAANFGWRFGSGSDEASIAAANARDLDFAYKRGLSISDLNERINLNKIIISARSAGGRKIPI